MSERDGDSLTLSLEGNSNLIQTNWKSPPTNPMDLMKDWVRQAKQAEFAEPLGMTLTTIDRSGLPWNRVVLIKQLDEFSIVFGSSSVSEKGKNIEHNSMVAGSLWWRESIQQIQFRGFASIAESRSEELFNKRSRKAKAVAICSSQSELLASEAELETKIAELVSSNKTLSKPATWNAYQIIPVEYEFWQGDASRLHKRLRYSLQTSPDLTQTHLAESELTDRNWIQQRLQP